jgi:hypothetical protein
MIAAKTAQKKVETTKNNLEQNKSSRYPGNPRCKKCKIPWGRFQVLAIYHSAQDFKDAYLHLQHPEGTQGIIGAKNVRSLGGRSSCLQFCIQNRTSRSPTYIFNIFKVPRES